jgi:hypothetical protein
LSPIRATCPAHLIDLIILYILGEEYKLWRSPIFDTHFYLQFINIITNE